MGNTNSSASTAASPDAKKPACKICCACPQERRARDECTLLKNMEDCESEMSAFYACLLREGFSAEEVDSLKRNTKKM